MTKPVFGRGGRRKRRRNRVVPPKGASRLWPKSHRYCRMINRIYQVATVGAATLLFMGLVRPDSRSPGGT